MSIDFSTAAYLNLHTHLPTHQHDWIEIENIHFNQEKSTQNGQWSSGIHPWYIRADQINAAVAWLNEQATLPDTWAIGECGLDKVCDTSFDVQLAAFNQAVAVAKKQQKPLIIHCVRAYSEVLSVLKLANFPAYRAVFHGFDKNWTTARMVLDAGYSLSFGKALFQGNSHAAQVLENTPPDRFFLETDNAPIQIPEVYLKAAALRKINLDEIRLTVAQNWSLLFG